MIRLTKCSVWLAEKKLLDSFTLSVNKGAFFCLIGESGGGKTLVSQLILDLLPPQFTISGSRECQQKGLKLVWQNPLDSLQRNLSIKTQFHQLLKSRGVNDRRKRIELMKAALNQVGFPHDQTIIAKRPYELSGGTCQKLAIALALVTDPELLIADEATSALDAKSQHKILTRFKEMTLQKQTTVFLITHDWEIVKRYSTDVGVIKDGQLVETGKTMDLLNNPQARYIKEVIRIFEDRRKITGN